MGKKAKISVIILNWNGKELLKRFLPSVVKNTKDDFAEVIVADNGSDDGSVDMLKSGFPEAGVIEFPRNYGFAGGYNRAVAETDTEYVLLLNSDVEVGAGWLAPLFEYMEAHPDVAAVQPKILSLNDEGRFEYAGACGGFIDRFGFPFCRGRILNSTEKDCGQYDSKEEVFWCSGAAMLVRRSVYLEAGGLDERFFAHMEEIDLCWRMYSLGYRMAVCPDSAVRHLGGGTLPMNHPEKLRLNYRNNLLMLYKNLSRSAFANVMAYRVFIDLASAVFFLLKGEFRNCSAVFRAYSEFLSMRSLYSHSCRTFERSAVYPGSIIAGYYAHGIKCFSGLRYKLKGGCFVKRSTNGEQ